MQHDHFDSYLETDVVDVGLTTSMTEFIGESSSTSCAVF
jgi:hypothetical protein